MTCWSSAAPMASSSGQSPGSSSSASQSERIDVRGKPWASIEVRT